LINILIEKGVNIFIANLSLSNVTGNTPNIISASSSIFLTKLAIISSAEEHKSYISFLITFLSFLKFSFSFSISYITVLSTGDGLYFSIFLLIT
jgi:hypothetical protein